MSMHTPGPWEVTTHPNQSAILITAGANIIAVPGYTENDDEYAANARLIAAAPDLLEALRCHYDDACDRGETTDEDGKEYDDYRAIRRAIEKATGEDLS